MGRSGHPGATKLTETKYCLFSLNEADISWFSKSLPRLLLILFNFKLQQIFEFSSPSSKEKDQINLDVI